MKDFDELTARVREEITKEAAADENGLYLKPEEYEKRRAQKLLIREMLRSCSQGNMSARSFMLEHVNSVLTKEFGYAGRRIDRLGFMKEPESPMIKYMLMYVSEFEAGTVRIFETLARRFSWSGPEITSKMIDEAFSEYKQPTNMIKQKALSYLVFSECWGHSCADCLIADPSFDEIEGGVGGSTVNDYDYRRAGRAECSSYDVVYVIFHGKKIRMSFMTFGSEAVLRRVTKNLCRFGASEELSESMPAMSTNMANGDRVTAARPPASATWCFLVRKFEAGERKRITQAYTQPGSELIESFLGLILGAGENVIYSGDNGTGKTTLMKNSIAMYDPLLSVRQAGTTFETKLNSLYPERNIMMLRLRENLGIEEIIGIFKKSSTDIFVLDEVTTPEMVTALIETVQSLGKTVVTTVHHHSVREFVEYGRNALMMTLGIGDRLEAERQVAESINFDIHCVCDEVHGFIVERITQIAVGEEPQEVASDSEGKRLYYERMLKGVYEARDIIVFDRKSGRYVFRERPSEACLLRMKKVLGEERVSECIYSLES